MAAPHQDQDRKRTAPSTAAPQASNQFANDGSFMEMFRRRMGEQTKGKTTEEGRGEAKSGQKRDHPSAPSGQEASQGNARREAGGETKPTDKKQTSETSSSSSKAYQVVKWYSIRAAVLWH